MLEALSAFPDLKNWNWVKSTVAPLFTAGVGVAPSEVVKPCAYTVFQVPPEL